MTKQSIHIRVTNSEAAMIAARTTDAYSFDRYGRGPWTMIAKRLAQRGYDAQQIEAVLRSKITRWAADSARVPTSMDVLRFLDDQTNGGEGYVEEITQQTFGDKRLHPHARGLQPSPTALSGAVLARVCSANEIADLIDFALAVRDDAPQIGYKDAPLAIDVLRDRAARILDRIARRAK